MNPNDNSAKKPDDNHAALPPSHPVSAGVGVEAEAPVVTSELSKTPVELEVSKEVKEHIVVSNNTIEVPPDLQNVGVTRSPHDQAAPSNIQQSTNLPLTDDQIGEGLSKKPNTNFRWLSEWCVRQLHILHKHLKKVHGHFIRVKDQ